MTQTFRQFVNWLKMNIRHLIAWLKSCTELNSQINKGSNRQCTVFSQKWDFFHPSWHRLAFTSFKKSGRTPCIFLPVSAWFITCPDPHSWRAVRKRKGLQCTLFCVSQNTLAWNMRWGAMFFRGQRKLHLLLWSFSRAASFQEQIVFTHLLEQTWLEWFS